MKVVKADILGYCFGVKRAVEKATEALQKSNVPVYSLGQLIHNKTTLENLQKSGLKIAEKIDDIPNNSTVIIRAHGVPPSVINLLTEKNCNIIDATCPRVKKSQKIASENSSAKIIFTGDAEHGEVKGIQGFAGKDFFLIQNVFDAEKLPEFGENEKIVFFSQTTFSEEDFLDIENYLSQKYNNFTALNTICPSTKERQEALINLCKKVSGVIVIGGKESANTLRLFQIAKKNCKYSCHIECAEEIPSEFFTLEKVGVTAGASTPDEVIESVICSLEKNMKMK